MNTIDPQKAARVWQRVQGTDRLNDRELLTMIAREWTDAAVYLLLSRRFQGKDSALLRRMYEEEQAHTACLKGIYTLITGRKAIVPHPTVSDDPPEVVLRRCYGREMRCLAQYESRQTDAQYGHIFHKLAQQEQAHCHRILEMLGVLAK